MRDIKITILVRHSIISKSINLFYFVALPLFFLFYSGWIMSFAAVAVGIVAALATHSACERIELNIDFFRFFPRSFNEYIFSRIYVEHSDFPAEICFWSSYRKKWSGIISESASEEFLEYVQDVKQLHGALEDLENILIEQL